MHVKKGLTILKYFEFQVISVDFTMVTLIFTKNHENISDPLRIDTARIAQSLVFYVVKMSLSKKDWIFPCYLSPLFLLWIKKTLIDNYLVSNAFIVFFDTIHTTLSMMLWSMTLYIQDTKQQTFIFKTRCWLVHAKGILFLHEICQILEG